MRVENIKNMQSKNPIFELEQMGSHGVELLDERNKYYFKYIQLQPRFIMEGVAGLLTEYQTFMAA